MSCAPQGAFDCTLGSPVVCAADHQDLHSHLVGGKLAAVVARVDLADLATACDEGWAKVKPTPGYLSEKESRFLRLEQVAVQALASPRAPRLRECPSICEAIVRRSVNLPVSTAVST